MADSQTTDIAEMFAAIDAENYVRVDELLKQGVDPNAVSESGTTALYVAACSSAITNLLLENNGRPQLDAFNELPIHTAIRCNIPGVVSLYLEKYPLNKKARVEFYDQLCHAAGCGHLDVVRILLAHKVPTFISGKRSPLYWAAEIGSLVVCDILLKHEITHRSILARSFGYLDIDPVPGESLFLSVVETYNAQLVGVFLDNLPYLCDAMANGNDPCFFRAVHAMEVDVAREFLKHGTDIERKNRSGQRALHIAVQRAEYYADRALEPVNERPMSRSRTVDKTTTKEMIELLLENGASIDAKDNWGRDPLYHTTDATLKEFMQKNAKPPKGRGVINLLVKQRTPSKGLLRRTSKKEARPFREGSRVAF